MNTFEKTTTVSSFESTIEKPWAEMRPTFEAFAEIHSKRKIEEDKKRLRKMRGEIFAKEANQRGNNLEVGESLEYCLMELLHNQGWFDDSVTVSPGSEYDDYFAHLDFALTFCVSDDEDNPEFENLAVDATSSMNPENILKKENILYEMLRQGDLTRAEYFVNDQSPELEKEVFMPRIILNILPAEVMELKNLLVKGKNLTISEKEKMGQYKKQILAEIETQLQKCINAIVNMSNSMNPSLEKKRAGALAKYKKVLELFREKKSE